MPDASYTQDELMIIAASRELRSDDVCFVGIGAPSAACNLARLMHAPDITLIYESGTIGAAPDVLPLSIGDGELCETSLTTVPVTEMFRYWLQGGRITVGFLGAAQLDRFGNINTTVIGPYDQPKVRLPGGGGAPEIATQCQKVFIVMKQSHRSFSEKIDFFTSLGFGQGGDERERLGVRTSGPVLLVTDMAVWRPDPVSREFVVETMHPGVTREMMAGSVGWDITYAASTGETPPPSCDEICTLRDLQKRTRAAHATNRS